MALDDPLVSRDAEFSEDHNVMSPVKRKQSLMTLQEKESGGGAGILGPMDDDEGPLGAGEEIDWFEQELDCLARYVLLEQLTCIFRLLTFPSPPSLRFGPGPAL